MEGRLDEREVFDLKQNKEGVWELLEGLNLSSEAVACIKEIDGFAEMDNGERVAALVQVMEEKSPKNADEVLTKNHNRFVVRELSTVAGILEAYRKVEEATREYQSLGGRLDVLA